jgi:twitching motility protein PilI
MAQRISLPAYQRNLTERLKTAEAGDAAGSRLGIEAGEELWLVDLADAGDVLTLPALERVPLTKPWFAGMVHIRGNLYAVVDFSAFLGAPAVPHSEQTRVLLIGERHRINSGLMVNRVIGLRRTDTMRPRQARAGSASWLAKEFVDGDGCVWKLLDVAALVTSPEFLHVEQ